MTFTVSRNKKKARIYNGNDRRETIWLQFCLTHLYSFLSHLPLIGVSSWWQVKERWGLGGASSPLAPSAALEAKFLILPNRRSVLILLLIWRPEIDRSLLDIYIKGVIMSVSYVGVSRPGESQGVSDRRKLLSAFLHLTRKGRACSCWWRWLVLLLL